MTTQSEPISTKHYPPSRLLRRLGQHLAGDPRRRSRCAAVPRRAIRFVIAGGDSFRSRHSAKGSTAGEPPEWRAHLDTRITMMALPTDFYSGPSTHYVLSHRSHSLIIAVCVALLTLTMTGSVPPPAIYSMLIAIGGNRHTVPSGLRASFTPSWVATAVLIAVARQCVLVDLPKQETRDVHLSLP